MAVLIALLGALPGPAVALKTAQMKLPAGFAESAQRVAVSGYGGANKGRYQMAGFGGEFTRVETRLAIFDPLIAFNRGSASYTMQGDGLSAQVAGECRFRQNVVTKGVVTFDPKRLVFDCELSGGGNEPSGRLMLGEPKKEGFKQKLLAQATRRGNADLGDMSIGIESVHAYEGSRLQAPAPVGYLLSIDSTVVAALELTDVNPAIYLAQRLEGADRVAVLRVAIAVSLLRDPAASPLGD